MKCMHKATTGSGEKGAQRAVMEVLAEVTIAEGFDFTKRFSS